MNTQDSDAPERRRYALLQAAAAIYSGSLITPLDSSSHPTPHYWENHESAVVVAEAILAEIERRERVEAER